MRPRVIRSTSVADQPASLAPGASIVPLQVVADRAARMDSHELWIAVHVLALQGVRSDSNLEQLALGAQRFTPRVSLVPPDGMLLEVKGSLHLFGGVSGILRALTDEYASKEIALALAPTPLAALLAARLGRPFVVTDKAQLIGQLAPLSLAPLRWPERTIERLACLGVRTVGQALRLPRAGFARRFGVARLAELDRLTGREADLRACFQRRERFRRRCELLYELESHATLLEAIAPLLKDLGKFLQARQSGVMQLECVLHHRHVAPTRCRLRLAAPMGNIERLTELLGERLSALQLPEPVRACELRSGRLTRLVLASVSLWQPGEQGGGSAPSQDLLERLRARLGAGAVYGLCALATHRPESACGRTEPAALLSKGAQRTTPWAPCHRPLWLLPAPQLLDSDEGMPRHQGSLRLCGDLERLETGWWDGREIERDYYTACDSRGMRLWIFRERAAPRRWFLHGVFG